MLINILYKTVSNFIELYFANLRLVLLTTYLKLQLLLQEQFQIPCDPRFP